jgi:hypothetical protein
MSDYIIVNLNQTVNRAQLLEQKRERMRWVIFAVFLLAFIGAGATLYRFYGEMETLIQLRKERIADVKNQIARLKEKEGIDLSKSDIESLYKLESKRILWADKLKVLSEITPDYMAITEIEYTTTKSRGTNKVVISAISRIFTDEKDFTVVEKFINLLKSNPVFSEDFKNIKFISSNRFISRGQEILQFKIEASTESTKKARSVKRKRKV